MDILLWALQIILAVKLASVVYTHGLRPDAAKMRGDAAARPLLPLVALGAALGATGLILPAAVPALAGWMPWFAALLAGVMLAAVGLHQGCRQRPNFVVGLVLFALAAFVAYGRWALAPL